MPHMVFHTLVNAVVHCNEANKRVLLCRVAHCDPLAVTFGVSTTYPHIAERYTVSGIKGTVQDAL